MDGIHPNDIGMMKYATAYASKITQIRHEALDNDFLPALIPLPSSLEWRDGAIDIRKLKTIVVTDTFALNEAKTLQKFLSTQRIHAQIVSAHSSEEPSLLIHKTSAGSSSPEKYILTVSAGNIQLSASDPHGIFNGIQTLKQLMADPEKVPACHIEDEPAFSGRGYMVDVGRNFFPMDLLKQQIDIMARYKLNVFHFHATEDIAWRFEVAGYPQLTAASNMLRNRGAFYSRKDIQELIRYCKERHITFVPEIDMPGHSAAFKRAMGVDMQSADGISFLKNILREICTYYDISYVHIGADEVKITNRDFVPEITHFIEGLGKKVIGWQPGGNFLPSTIRQLWMDDNAHLTAKDSLQLIDSRHLYINHFDPLESVTTVFNRAIGGRERGDSSMLGATLCMWNDRRVDDARDILKMNPVYPSMLAFAERAWKGGGKKQWISNVDDGDFYSFGQFEKRLIDHQHRYFKNLPFPYARQGNLHWQLFGPYDNGGNLEASFTPETDANHGRWKFLKSETGGTIVLRHWWYPLIQGAVANPVENSTIYAYTKIWSAHTGRYPFWIGFNNLSRSPATDSPPAGGWDDKKNRVWVNHQEVVPPTWKHGGKKGNSETPLADEGYEYRAPTYIELREGWNEVLLKCPVGKFKGRDWQNPVKWMFTFVPVADNTVHD